MRFPLSTIAAVAASALMPLAVHAGDACWAWSAVERVPALAAPSTSTSLAVDGQGVVWLLTAQKVQTRGSRLVLQQRMADGRWSQSVELAGRADAQFRDVRITTDDAGNALAVWRREGPARGERAVMAAGYTVAGGWEAPRELAPKPSVMVPALAMASNGRSLIATADQALQSPMYLTSWSPQQGWGAALQTPPIDHSRELLSVAVNSAGQAMLALPTRTHTWVMLRAAGDARWSNAAAINEPGRVQDLALAPVAVNEAGEGLVTWTDRERPQRWRINARRLNVAQGAWQAAETLSTGRKAEHTNPAVALNDSGRAMVGWMRWQTLTSPDQVQTRVGEQAQRWRAIQNPTNGLLPSKPPLVSIDAAGQTVTVWQTREAERRGGVVSDVALSNGQHLVTTHAAPDITTPTDRPLWFSARNGHTLLAWGVGDDGASHNLALQIGGPQAGEGCTAP